MYVLLKFPILQYMGIHLNFIASFSKEPVFFIKVWILFLRFRFLWVLKFWKLAYAINCPLSPTISCGQHVNFVASQWSLVVTFSKIVSGDYLNHCRCFWGFSSSSNFCVHHCWEIIFHGQVTWYAGDMLLWNNGIGIRKISTMQGIKCDIGGKISNFSRKKNMRKIKQRMPKKC